MPFLCSTPAHSRSSVPSRREIAFATSAPLSGSGLINGIAIIHFAIKLVIMTSACRCFWKSGAKVRQKKRNIVCVIHTMFEKKNAIRAREVYLLRLEFLIIAWKIAAQIHSTTLIMILRKRGRSFMCQGRLV